jgi:ABC-type multidrug transport system fused ATPase/permease subunit
MLRDAPIVLLDEPTSALDAESEALIQTAMEQILSGRTVITIAHRLSTVMKADLICFMEDGRIVEKGSHAELVARGGRYSQVVRKQVWQDSSTGRQEGKHPVSVGELLS